MYTKILSFFTLLILICGCTVKGREIAHTPLLERGKPKGVSLTVVQFEDLRKDQAVVVQAFYGIPVLKTNPYRELNEIFDEVFEKELKHIGYQVVDNSRYKIRGKILEANNRINFSTRGRIQIELSLYDDDSCLLQKNYVSQNGSTFGIADDQLSVCLQEILMAFSEDINRIFQGQNL